MRSWSLLQYETGQLLYTPRPPTLLCLPMYTTTLHSYVKTVSLWIRGMHSWLWMELAMDIIHQSMHISASWNLVKSRKIPLPWSNFIVLGVLLTMLQLIVSYAPVPVTLQDSNLSFYKSTKVTYQHGEVTKHVLFVVTNYLHNTQMQAPYPSRIFSNHRSNNT